MNVHPDTAGLRRIILALLLIIGVVHSFAQSDTTAVPAQTDSLIVSQEGLLLSNDSTGVDSVTVQSEAAINASIFYDAQDSIVFDAINNKVRLYGSAVVKYEKMTLEAAFIEYDFGASEACATGVPDSTGVLTGKPLFDDEGQSFTQEYLCYNFKSQKGFSKVAVTQEGEAVFHAGSSKRHTNEWIHIKDGKFTTCDAENPHFHFQLSKAIIVPDEKVVSGPLYMKIRKVPTPLALPFAWFPTKNESTHGVVFPGYGNANNLGFFLKDGGYYFPIGRTVDTRILGDIYSRGSWSLRNITNYRKRYKFNGSFNISRTVIRQGIPELPDFSKATEFFVRWNHRQDPKARPNSNFSTNINFGTANNFRNNLNSSQTEFLSNTFTSSAQWSKSFPGTPYSVAVNARHSQNSSTGNVEMLLPGITLNRNRTNLPVSKLFGRKTPSRKWYDKIGLTYSANFENLLREDVKNIRWDQASELSRSSQNGIRQSATLSTQGKIGFVSFTPNFSYNEYWTFKYVDEVQDQATGAFETDTLSGFRSARDWRASGSFNTRFYGTFNFRKSKRLKAIRHVVTPQAGVSYVPRFNRNRFYFDGEEGNLQSYTTFDAARFRPGNTNEQFNLNFSLSNNLEMKTLDREKGRGATKKVKLIENFIVSSSYNMIADSLNLAPISVRGFTTLFNNLTMNVGSIYSAYQRDSLGREIDAFMAESGRQLLRLRSASVALNMNIRSKQRRGERDESNATEEQLEAIEQNSDQFVDFNIPWSLRLSYTLDLNRQWDVAAQSDQDRITQSIMFRGDFTVLERWKIGFDSGYDLVAGQFTSTQLNLYWDLHCWELTFNWIPFGIRQSFSLQLNVKSSLLQDLKLQARRGQNGILN